jgi:hypothetical protein
LGSGGLHYSEKGILRRSIWFDEFCGPFKDTNRRNVAGAIDPPRRAGAKYLLLIVIAAEKLEKQNADDNAEDDSHRPPPNGGIE